MITDQNQTGVPSVSRPRVQLTKPVQTYNAGRIAPSRPVAPAARTADRPSIPFNEAAAQGFAPKPAGINSLAASSDTPEAATERGEIYNPFQPKGYVDPLVEAAGAAAAPTPSNIERVRQLIGDMTDDEILQVLNSLSDGSLKGRDHRVQSGIPAAPSEEIMGSGTAPILR